MAIIEIGYVEAIYRYPVKSMRGEPRHAFAASTPREAGGLVEVLSSIDTLQLGGGQRTDRPIRIGGALQRRVVDHDDFAVFRQADVQFAAIHALSLIHI